MGFTPRGFVSTSNSTTANLNAAAVFSGTTEDVSQFASIVVTVFSSHASATDGLALLQSSNGDNWDLADTYTISATVGRTYSVQVAARYFRLVYTNGGSTTTSLRIQTVYHTSNKKGSSTRPQDARTNETDMEESLSYLMQFNGTTWDRARGDTTNGIDVDVTRGFLQGDIAHDSPDSTSFPIKVGFKATNALPTAVASADRANGISDLWGRQMVTHIDPAQQVWKSFNATTQQTGTDVWTPASGKKIAITSIIVGTYGTTSGRVILWFGDNADTTYTAGTDQLVFAFSTAPSANSKPGLVFTPAFPIFCTTADRELHITTDAAVSIDITLYGYEW